MDTTVNGLRRWIRDHYVDAPNYDTLVSLLAHNADPMVSALDLLLTRLQDTSSDWLYSYARELYKSLREPYMIVEPPPRGLNAVEMEWRLRGAALATRNTFKVTCRGWVVALEGEGEPFKVAAVDLEALRDVTNALASLKVLKRVRREMGAVVEAAKARRERDVGRARRKSERRERRRQAALDELGLGQQRKRSRLPVVDCILASRRKRR
jgi:hypothetical protein